MHVFVGGVEEKLMANKAIKQVVEVMTHPGGKMSRVQEILRCASSFLLPPSTVRLLQLHCCQHHVFFKSFRTIAMQSVRHACWLTSRDYIGQSAAIRCAAFAKPKQTRTSAGAQVLPARHPHPGVLLH